MRKILFISFFGLLLFFNSCSPTRNIGLSDHTGFVELPFPSNNFKPGQIIEVYSKPTKVEITHQPSINWDQIDSSPGWSISSAQTKQIEGALSTEISNLLKAKYNYANSENVKVQFTNTKTTVVPKSTIYSAVKSELKNNSELNEQITDFMADGTHFDVITSTLSANISFKLVNSSNQSVDIDSEVIEKINSQFDIDFSKVKNGDKVIAGENLVIGIHKDPKIVRLIMNRLRKER